MPKKNMSVAIRESQALIEISGKLFASGMYPAIKSPAMAFAVTQYGAENEVPPMTSLQNIIVIGGKPVVMAELLQAKMMDRGVAIETLEWNDQVCRLKGVRKGQPPVTIEFTVEEAKKANLLGKDNWKNYTKAMLWARAISRLKKVIAPDCFMGAITPDEAQDMGNLPPVDATDHRANAREAERLLTEEKGIKQEAITEARLAYLKRKDSGEPVDDIDLAEELTVIEYIEKYLRPTYKRTKTATLAQRAAQKANGKKETAPAATPAPKAATETAPAQKAPDAPRRTLVEVQKLRDDLLTKMTPDEVMNYSDESLLEYTEVGLIEVWGELTAIQERP